jgi:hypothetical protein
MKIKSVRLNNHKRAFEIRTCKGQYVLPFAKVGLRPTRTNPVRDLYVDAELGDEAFTYILESGEEESIHIDQVLEYNRDPAYMRDLLLYKLTLEAGRCVASSELSKRELSRRLGTSPTQLYRLLDEENYGKTIDQMIELLAILDCPVEIKVAKPKDKGRAARRPSAA